jgi:hypothetical protein
MMMESILIAGLPNSFGQDAAVMRQRRVEARFGEWLGSDSSPLASLGLSVFVGQEPLAYINDDVIRTTLPLLEQDFTTTLNVLREYDLPLTHAINSLLREGSSWGQEHRLEVRSPIRLLEFEQIWHAEYQRYAEHIFNHLIRVPLGVLGTLRKKDYAGPRLAVRIDVLKQNKLDVLARGLDPVVRNAISHGTTIFGTDAIRYVDAKTSKDLSPSAFGTLFDDLVETCHGLVAAVLIWAVRHWPEVAKAGTQMLPGGIRRVLMQGFIEHPGLRITSVIEADFPVQLSQVNVFCTSSTRARTTHLVEAVWIAAAMVSFGASSTEWILVHVECGAGVPSLVTLKVKTVQRLLDEGFSEELAKEAVQGSFLWHDTSALRQRIWTYTTAARLVWERMKEETVSEWRERGLEVWSSRYKVKQVKHGRRRIDVELALTTREAVTKHLIRGVLQHATRKLRRTLIPANAETGLRVPLPPLYVCFRIHARNRTTRSLGLDGWRDVNTLAQGEWRARRRRKQHPLWVKLPDEHVGGLLIRYNPNLTLQEGEPPTLRVPKRN